VACYRVNFTFTFRVCVVDLFNQTGSSAEIQVGFRRELHEQEATSPNEIRRWLRQWREEGSVACKRPPGRPSSVRTPEKIARVLAILGRSPSRSARRHVQVLGMPDSCLWHV
jgi:transposase